MRIYISPAAIDRMEPIELVSAEDELDRAIRRLFAAPDVARAMEREMAAFDDACHEELVADRAEALAQTEAQALIYAVEEGDRRLLRAILATLLAGGVDHVYRVFACADGAAQLWMSGNAKVRSSELRDEAIRVLERGGFQVERRGCWDISVRRQER